MQTMPNTHTHIHTFMLREQPNKNNILVCSKDPEVSEETKHSRLSFEEMCNCRPSIMFPFTVGSKYRTYSFSEAWKTFPKMAKRVSNKIHQKGKCNLPKICKNQQLL